MTTDDGLPGTFSDMPGEIPSCMAMSDTSTEVQIAFVSETRLKQGVVGVDVPSEVATTVLPGLETISEYGDVCI